MSILKITDDEGDTIEIERDVTTITTADGNGGRYEVSVRLQPCDMRAIAAYYSLLADDMEKGGES
jgi:hypothetical protein